MKFILALIIILSTHALYADVSVVTYNMAQLKKNGLDLVACTKRRVPLQMEAIFKDTASPIYAAKNFVLMIQESWTKRTFEAMKKAALERGFTIFPMEHKFVKNRGDLIVTNIPVLEAKFTAFSSDKYAEKGITYAQLDLGNGKTFGVINTHTGYSDATGFSDEHRRHFEELGQAIEVLKPKSTYFVTGGDFNAGPDMGFKVTKFDAVGSIWENGIMPLMRNQNMRLLESVGITWDDTNNTLVSRPPLLLRIVNEWKNGYIGWDQTDSTLDHIFVQEEMEVLRHEIVFKKKYPLRCGGREDKDGLTNISDHYGVMAVLKTDT